jgi:hypothetical protein
MKVLLLTIILIFCSAMAFAHSGGTDSSGGHYNRSTGSYHYHQGHGGGSGGSVQSDNYSRDNLLPWFWIISFFITISVLRSGDSDKKMLVSFLQLEGVLIVALLFLYLIFHYVFPSLVKALIAIPLPIIGIIGLIIYLWVKFFKK